MKKVIFSLAFLTAISLGISANNSDEKFEVIAKPENKTLNEKEIKQIVDRVNEIRDMDLKGLSPSQKSELRKELREMKKTMAIGGGVYIGGTALVIIIVLLLLLLL